MKNIYFKTFLVVAGLGFGLSSFAQQDPYYSHFKFNKQAYNPAAVGEKDDLVCINGVAHNQWRNYDDYTFIERRGPGDGDRQQLINDVAPVTYNLNVGTQITTNKGKRTWGGIGFSIYDDKLGFMKSTTFRVQMAYFVPIQGNFARLSFGPELGMYQFGIVDPKFPFSRSE